MRFGITNLLLPLWLVGCAQGLSEQAIKFTQPDLIIYPAETMTAAAAELDGGKCPVLNGLIVDYGVTRDQIRVALGQKVNVGRK